MPRQLRVNGAIGFGTVQRNRNELCFGDGFLLVNNSYYFGLLFFVFKGPCLRKSPEIFSNVSVFVGLQFGVVGRIFFSNADNVWGKSGFFRTLERRQEHATRVNRAIGPAIICAVPFYVPRLFSCTVCCTLANCTGMRRNFTGFVFGIGTHVLWNAYLNI